MQRLDFELNGGITSETVADARGVEREVRRQNIIKGRVIVTERDIVVEVQSADPVSHPAMVVASIVDGDLVVSGTPLATVDPAEQAETDRKAREALLSAPRETRPPTVPSSAAVPVIFGVPSIPPDESDAERLAREKNERELAVERASETDAQRLTREAREARLREAGVLVPEMTDAERLAAKKAANDHAAEIEARQREAVDPVTASSFVTSNADLAAENKAQSEREAAERAKR
jgi:hypothetical protein